jgi:hypothetical protein
MEMQQIIEMLLTNQAKLEADKEEVIARMDAMLATQVKMNEFKEDLKTMQERASVEIKSDRGNVTSNKSRSGTVTRESKENDGRNDKREPSQERHKA